MSPTTIIRVGGETTADELREAITWCPEAAAAIPDYARELRDKSHARIDALLSELEQREGR